MTSTFASPGRYSLIKAVFQRRLFNIPRTGQMDGIRPLSRLALCDHRRAVRKQIELCLRQATSENATGGPGEHIEFPISSDDIDVYIVASTVGGTGTGSGAVADPGLMVQSTASSESFGNINIHGVLLHGTGSERSTTDVQDANTVSTLKELRHLSTAGMGASTETPRFVTLHRSTTLTSSILATD